MRYEFSQVMNIILPLSIKLKFIK